MRLRSWGRLSYFERVFATPSDGFKRISFFNKNLNDTKDIEVVSPPTYDKTSGKMRVVLKVQYHKDIDVHKDYIADPYRRGGGSSAAPSGWPIPYTTSRLFSTPAALPEEPVLPAWPGAVVCAWGAGSRAIRSL